MFVWISINTKIQFLKNNNTSYTEKGTKNWFLLKMGSQKKNRERENGIPNKKNVFPIIKEENSNILYFNISIPNN